MTLWTLPIVGALLGWATNWLAIRMLFRPRKPIRIFRWRVWGLIPSRRAQLAERIAVAIEERLVSSSDITELLQSKSVKAAVRNSVRQHVTETLDRKLNGLRKVIAAVHPGQHRWLSELPGSAAAHAAATLPKLTRSISGDVAASIDLKPLVRSKIEAFTDEELEALVTGVAGREMKAIERLGIIIGAVVGGLQWLLLVAL